MAHFEKVCTGRERWTAQWPCTHASHEPITRWPGGVAHSLRCGTVSNAAEGDKGERTEVPSGVGPSDLQPGKR